MGKKIKQLAPAIAAPATHEEVNKFISIIGTHQRERERIQTEMNERLAALKEGYEAAALPHKEAIEAYLGALAAYCNTHREELLKGSAKTYRFSAGDVSWRNRPARVVVRDTVRAITWYAQKRLRKFIRVKEELNKDQMLRDVTGASKNPFIKIGSAGEDFCVTPFETELEEVAS